MGPHPYIRRTRIPDSCRADREKKCVAHMQLMRQQVYYGIPHVEDEVSDEKKI